MPRRMAAPRTATSQPPARRGGRSAMDETTRADPYALPPDAIREPPRSLGRALREIGPGLIIFFFIVWSC